MTETKYLILGAGPASAWAVRGIRGEDKEGTLTLVGSEPYRTYSLPMLSKGFVQGRYPEEKLFLVKEDFYESNGVRFVSGNGALSLDTDGRTVTLGDGGEITYEKLLICTGGSPVKFDLPQSSLRRIYYLRTLDDAKIIKAAAESASNAVVIGGSFIGVELAAALRDLGLSVKLLMMEDYVWQQLLPESVGDYLNGLLRENGVQVYPHEKVVEFSGNNGLAETVLTETMELYDGDLFAVGIGMRPNTGFLAHSGVDTGRGIIVNEYLETSVEGVYAAGDVAEFEDAALGFRHVSGHIENAQQQGRTAGKNMAGAREEYSKITGYDTEIFGSMLMFIGAPEMYETRYVREKDGVPVASFSVKEGRITGGLLINPGGKDIRAFKELAGMKDINCTSYEEEFCDPGEPLQEILGKVKKDMGAGSDE